jgi:hypothetical protein
MKHLQYLEVIQKVCWNDRPIIALCLILCVRSNLKCENTSGGEHLDRSPVAKRFPRKIINLMHDCIKLSLGQTVKAPTLGQTATTAP